MAGSRAQTHIRVLNVDKCLEMVQFEEALIRCSSLKNLCTCAGEGPQLWVMISRGVWQLAHIATAEQLKCLPVLMRDHSCSLWSAVVTRTKGMGAMKPNSAPAGWGTSTSVLVRSNAKPASITTLQVLKSRSQQHWYASTLMLKQHA